MVASTRSSPPGLFYPRYGVTLHFGQGVRVGDVRLAGNDVLDLDLIDHEGRAVALRMAYADRWTLVGTTSPVLAPILDGPEDHIMGLHSRQAGDRLRFALALHSGGQDQAQEAARAAIGLELERIFSDRVAFFERLPSLATGTDEAMRRLYAKAYSVLKVNAMTGEGQIGHRWTTPDRWPHRHMWLWDSAFHAPAYALLDPTWGQDALLAVLEAAYDDGFIAHMITPADTSKITQPPVLAWACWAVYQVSRDRAFLEAAYLPLCRYLGWRIEGNRLSRSGESGMDNSSRFDPDGPWDHVDFNAYTVNDMAHVALIARELGKEAEAIQWQSRADALAARVNALLWDEESGFYYDRQVNGGLFKLKSNAGLLPLWAGIPNAEQAARLVQHLLDPDEFRPPFPVPTIALDEPSYEPDMWRGPTWININNLIRLGLKRYGYDELAGQLRQVTLA
jgi:hypothetical protein